MYAAHHEARELREEYIALLLDRLEAASTVLEIGSGNGIPVAQASAGRHRLTGIDISGGQVEPARRHVPATAFIKAEVMATDFPAATFDAVVSFYAILHIPREEHWTLLCRTYRWLRSGGWLWVNLGAGEWIARKSGAPRFHAANYVPLVSRAVSLPDHGFEVVDNVVVCRLPGPLRARRTRGPVQRRRVGILGSRRQVSAALHQAPNPLEVVVPGGNVKRRRRPSRELERSLERVTSVHRFPVGK